MTFANIDYSYDSIRNLSKELEENIKTFFNNTKNVGFENNRLIIKKEILISKLELTIVKIIEENNSLFSESILNSDLDFTYKNSFENQKYDEFKVVNNDLKDQKIEKSKVEKNYFLESGVLNNGIYGVTQNHSEDKNFQNALLKNKEKIIQLILTRLASVNDERHYLNVYKKAFSQTFKGSIISNENIKPKLFLDNACIYNLETESVEHEKIELNKSIYIQSPVLWNNKNENLGFYGMKNDIINIDTDLNEFTNNSNLNTNISNFDSNEKNKEFLLNQINNIIGGKITKSESDDVYFEYASTENKKFHIDDMGSGIRTFAILSLLIQNNQLDDRTLLIIDEPEAHLHTEWQFKFAQCLVLLNKIFNVKVLINSHSSLFIQTIESYSKKEEINKNVNFYLTKINENGLEVYLQEITDVDDIAEKLDKPYIYVTDIDIEVEVKEETKNANINR